MHTTTDPLTHDDDSNDDKVCKNVTEQTFGLRAVAQLGVSYII